MKCVAYHIADERRYSVLTKTSPRKIAKTASGRNGQNLIGLVSDCPMRAIHWLQAATWLFGWLLASSLTAIAQDGSGPIPENAEARSYGSGWECIIGYRLVDGACIRLELPDNAYATGRSYGPGWACRRGFRSEDGTTCEAIYVPENAFLKSSGHGWQCDRGFAERDGRCEPISLPANAYLDSDPYGPGWRCLRGYTRMNDSCVEIDLPENAHLDRSGNDWRCDRNFQLSGNECVLGR